MNCPNCGKEMKDKSYNYYGLGDWDMDYPPELHEEYWCKDCKIKYEDEEWIIPKKFEPPTEKQIKAISLINRNLGLDYVPLLKNKCIQFIKEHMEESKNVYKHRYDWIEPDDVFYGNDAWCEHY